MVAVIRLFHPALRGFASDFEILRGFDLVATQLAQPGKRTQAADRLDAQVDIVSEMAGEVVCAKLLFGIKSLFLQIIRPLLEPHPVKSGEIRIAFHDGDGSEKAEQISA